MLSTLQNKGYPNTFSSVKIIHIEFIKNIVILEREIAEHIEKMVLEISQKQMDLNLNTSALLEYEHKIVKEKIRKSGVIGGHHKKLIIFKKYFMKKMIGNHGLNEFFIYYLIHRKFPALIGHMIKCFGIVLISEKFKLNEEIMDKMVNGTFNPEVNIKGKEKNYHFYSLNE